MCRLAGGRGSPTVAAQLRAAATGAAPAGSSQRRLLYCPLAAFHSGPSGSTFKPLACVTQGRHHMSQRWSQQSGFGQSEFRQGPSEGLRV